MSREAEQITSLEEEKAPVFKPYPERSDLELFGGVYNAIVKGAMKFGNAKRKILKVIEKLKKDPVIRRNLQHCDKPDLMLNYYASDLVADLLQIGFDAYWCKRPETLEFVYRHGHHYLITSDVCINHDRMDIWNALFSKSYENPRFVTLYPTETPFKRKFEIYKQFEYCELRHGNYDDQIEDFLPLLNDWDASDAFYDEDKADILSIRYLLYDPKYNGNPKIRAYAELQLRKKESYDLTRCIKFDNLELFKYAESIHGREYIEGVVSHVHPNVIYMGVKIATYLGLETIKRIFRVPYKGVLLTKDAFESLELPYTSISDEKMDPDKYLLFNFIQVPDLDSRQRYYRKIHGESHGTYKDHLIDYLVKNKIAIEYFVSDSKTAVESKSDMSDIYLDIQKHPTILKYYLTHNLTLDFKLEDCHIQRFVIVYMDFDFMRTLYRMGYGRILKNADRIDNDFTVSELAFICLIIDPRFVNKFHRTCFHHMNHQKMEKHLEKHFKEPYRGIPLCYW